MARKARLDILPVVRDGLTKSLASLLIKMATAGLTYVMFVALSRAMDPTEYGRFAFGFSLATILAIGASMGQQTAILRYWPEDMGAGRPAGARRALGAGWSLTVGAGLLLSLLLCAVAAGIGLVGGGIMGAGNLFAASALILPLAAAEYGSSALRAQGSVWTAMMPRDIVWRGAVPLIVWGLFLAGTRLDGAQALLLTALLLVFCMVLQVAAARWRGYHNRLTLKGIGQYWRERGRASIWFLLGTVTDSAALNVDIILVGLFVAPDASGTYFNAFRTAGLMTLFMYAITLVIAPMVAKHYHGGDLRRAQAVTSFCAWAGFVFSLGVFVIFLLFGDLILSLFGPSYADAQLILLILSLGLLADAATGPTRIVMMMTGHERQYVMIFGSVMAAGFVIQLAVIPLFGLVGAALVNALAPFVAQLAIAWWTHRHVGLDTSLLGLKGLFGQKVAPAPDA